MRTGAFFVVLLLGLSPVVAGAQSASLETLCKGYTGNPSGQNFFDQSGDPAIMDTFLKRKVLCPSACYDVALTIGVQDNKLKITTSATDACTNPKPDASKIKNVFSPLEKPNASRNCVSDKGLPSVVAVSQPISAAQAFAGKLLGYSVPDVLSKSRTVGPKSRCNLAAITDVVNAFTQNKNAGLDKGFDRLAGLSSPTPVPNEPTTDPAVPVTQPAPDTTDVAKPATVPTDQEALAQVLTDKYGVPADQAKSLVESDSDKIKSMIEKSMTNDTAGAQAIAKDLNLNDDVMKSIAEMSPPKQITPDEAKEIADQQQLQRQNTFDQNPQSNSGLPTQCGTGGLAGNIMYAESRCAQINSNPLSSVQGPYHFLCGTWTSYANSTGNGEYANCGYRNDPAISTKVMNAKMDQFASQYGSQCSQAGLSVTSCQYAIHVFGEGGYRQIFNAYRNNPNDSAFSLCGSAISNTACSNNSSIFRNGGTVAGVFGELDRRLGGSGTVITSINPSASPFTGFTSGTGYNMNSGSPFGSVNPFYANPAGYSSPTGYSTPTSYAGYQPNAYGSGSIFSGLFGGGTQPAPVQNIPSQQISYAQQQAQAVVSIIAQPQNTYVGNFVVISWSSVGMKADQPCTALMLTKTSTTTIGTANEGSKIITASSTGILRFVVSCNALSGQTITQATAVAVQ